MKDPLFVFDEGEVRIANEEAKTDSGLIGWKTDLIIDQFGVVSDRSPRYYPPELVDEWIEKATAQIESGDFYVSRKHPPDSEMLSGNHDLLEEIFFPESVSRVIEDGRPKAVIHGMLEKCPEGERLRRRFKSGKKLPISASTKCRWIKGQINGKEKDIVQGGSLLPLGAAFIRKGGFGGSVGVVQESAAAQPPITQDKESEMDEKKLREEHPSLVAAIENAAKIKAEEGFAAQKAEFMKKATEQAAANTNLSTELTKIKGEKASLETELSNLKAEKKIADDIAVLDAEIEKLVSATKFPAVVRANLKEHAAIMTGDKTVSVAKAFMSSFGDVEKAKNGVKAMVALFEKTAAGSAGIPATDPDVKAGETSEENPGVKKIETVPQRAARMNKERDEYDK